MEAGQQSSSTVIKQKSLFNFLAYLLSIDHILVKIPEKASETAAQRPEFTVYGVYYVSSHDAKASLLKTFYPMLNDYRNSKRGDFIKEIEQENQSVLKKNEYFVPRINLRSA